MGRPKPWLTLGGETLLARTSRVMADCVSELIVSAVAGQELPPISPVFKRVNDMQSHQGPLVALGGSLLAAQPLQCESALVLAVDMPLVSIEMMRFLLQSLREEDDAVVPTVSGRLQPLCAVYRTRIGGFISSLSAEDQSMHAMLRRIQHRTLAEQDFPMALRSATSFCGVNTPDEYAELLASLEEASRSASSDPNHTH